MTTDFAVSIDAAYSSAEVRALDTFAIERLGIAGSTLMTQAATAALHVLRSRWSAARDLVVVCGGGLNGGDGYVLARLARGQGYRVRVIALVERSRLAGDAAWAAREAELAAVPIDSWSASSASLEAVLASADVVVDALLGIGLQRDLEGEFANVIASIARAGRPVLALDVPSGLCADTGAVRGVAVRATVTVTFIAAKTGLFLGAGPQQAGEIVLSRLALAPESLSSATPELRLLTAGALRRSLPARPRDAHKGMGGHVLVVGGGIGMSGAARLAGLAALRAGAGRVTVLTAAASVPAIAAGLAELMVRALGDEETEIGETLTRFAHPQAIVLGPGLGLDPWGRSVCRTVLAWARRAAIPLVLDADALTWLAESRVSIPATTVLTPHPGEAARLLGVDSPRVVQGDRPGALAAIVRAYGSVVVLKGAGTLIGAPGSCPALCRHGHPAMAAPGSGDVLAGMIGALLGQGLSAETAAEAAVLWHALAGEYVAAGADRGRLASELAHGLPAIWAEYVEGRVS